jgi:hypothetical protein
MHFAPPASLYQKRAESLDASLNLFFLVQLNESARSFPVYAVPAWTTSSEEPSASTAADLSCSCCLLWLAMRRLLSIQMRRTVMSAGLTPPILLA